MNKHPRNSPQPRITLSPCHLVTLSVLLLLSATPARACNVPVFRYALERWQSDSYLVIVFHKGPLSEEDRKIIDGIEQPPDRGRVAPNCNVHRVDLSKKVEPEVQQLFEEQKATTLPWLLVCYPPAARNKENVWSGPLRDKTTPTLRDSPARREIVRRILGGESAVFVFLPSGDAKKDSAAEKLLQEQLKRLQAELKLPELTDSIEDKLSGEEKVPLRLAFSSVRVSRDDPAEQMLVRMLLNSESELADRKDPMVFPIFGRGRVLYAIAGDGICKEVLSNTAKYLIGPCSCTVKQDNPGKDLLMVADWAAFRQGAQQPEEKPTPTKPKEAKKVPLPPAPPPPPAPVPPRAVPQQEAEVVAPPLFSRNLLLLAVAATSVLVVVTGVLALRPRKQ